MFEFFKSLNAKFFIFLLSGRKGFIPILSIYFLMLDNTTVNQIGIFMAIGYLASLILEIPSGYFSDRFGYRKTLILSKIFQFISTFLYLSGWFIDSPYNFYIFIFWMLFQAFWSSFNSWTISAFYHEILEKRWQEKLFAEKLWKLNGKVSLFSAFIMVLFPFSMWIHAIMPFLLTLLLDLIWLIAILFLPKVKTEYNIWKIKWIKELFFEAKKHNLLHISVFLWLIGWFFLWDTAFRWPYLIDLGFPLIWIGLVLGFSRIVRFVIWHYIHHLENYITMKQHFFFDMILFSFWYILIAYFNNPYVVWLIISIILWYKWGRISLIQSYLLKDYIKDKRYKATMLSIESQLTNIIWMFTSLMFGYIISTSYELWYFSLGISLFICLSISYYFIFTNKTS